MCLLASCLVVSLCSIVCADHLPPDFEQKVSEFHAVGIHEDSADVVEVHVDRPDQDVTLLLSAYNPAAWRVTASPSTNISRVIVTGINPQEVVSAPENAAIESPCPEYCPYLGYQIDSTDFRNGVTQLGFVGSELDSFQGRFSGSQFLIDSVQDDERILSGYPFEISASRFPDLMFQAIDYEANPKTVGWSTLAGPIQSSQQALPNVRHGFWNSVTIDPLRGTVYGSAPDPFIIADNQVSEMIVDAKQELIFPLGITFDTKRDRLVLGSYGGEGFLYTFDPGVEEWSVLSSLEGMNISALAYDADNDRLFGLEPTINRWPELHTFDPQTGSVISTWQLSHPFDPGMLDDTPAQLIVVDDYLVLKTAGQRPGVGREYFTYLLDSDQQQAWLIVVPEPNVRAALASILIVLLPWVRSSRRSALSVC